MVENKDKSNQRSHNVFYAFMDGEKKKKHMFAGPTISICWLVSALLDDMDGSIARGTDTTSQLGEALDHKILDPLGAWMALLAARGEDETVEEFLLLLFSQNSNLATINIHVTDCLSSKPKAVSKSHQVIHFPVIHESHPLESSMKVIHVHDSPY